MDLKNSAYSLTIALDIKEEAKGFLYLDDGETFKYTNGEFTTIRFDYKNKTLTSKIINGNYMNPSWFEKFTFLGISEKPTGVKLVINNKETHDLTYEANDGELSINLPAKLLSIHQEFILSLLP